MVDIESPTTENRRGKKRRKKKETTAAKYNGLPYGAAIKELKPGLVACYDNRPGNGKGLFWFQCFINWSLTY